MTASRYRLPALLCTLLLAGCALLIHPVAEMGMNDDFSYTRSVELLLQTGHVHYVGWAAAMLGWQLYLGALFTKLFGFSFSVVRASVLPVAMATAWLLQRSFVRAGLNEWNATLGTLTVTLSPLFLALSFSFMTDVPGLFCIVLCFYCCLRALQTTSDRAGAGWLAGAALGNALDGTVRQNAWLGVLIMVPCACWLLRHRRMVVVATAASYIISIAWIVWCLHWFNAQPYVLRYGAVVQSTNWLPLHVEALLPLQTLLDLALFSLPVLIAFIWAVPVPSQRRTFLSIGVIAAVGLATGFFKHYGDRLLAPYLGDAVTIYGAAANIERHGSRPVLLGLGARLAVSMILYAALVCLGIRLRKDAAGKAVQSKSTLGSMVSAKSLCVLTGPMLTVYAALLLPRGVVFDRYLLVPFPFVVLVTALFFQHKVRPRLPALCGAALCVFALYGIASMHDLFAMYRALVIVVSEVRATGVPRNAIDGGFEYNGWTQMLETPSLNSPEIQTPVHQYVPHPELANETGCHPQFPWLTPLVRPQFAVSFDAFACNGPTVFAPVVYRSWLSMHGVPLYVVRMDRQ